MDIMEALLTRRSVRLYRSVEIPLQTLKKIADAARFAPCNINCQPWQFVIVRDPSLREKLHPYIHLRAFVQVNGNSGDTRPTAYIIVLADTRAPRDSPAAMGAATQNILLAAWAEGVGSCWSETVDREQVAGALELPPHLKICWAIALGYPAEEPVAVVAAGGTQRFRDEQGQLVVQKRPFNEVVRIA